MQEFELSFEERAALRKKDRYMGIPEDAPDDFRVALRNMGPLTRKQTLKRLEKGTLSEKRYAELIEHFTRTTGVQGELHESAENSGGATSSPST